MVTISNQLRRHQINLSVCVIFFIFFEPAGRIYFYFYFHFNVHSSALKYILGYGGNGGWHYITYTETRLKKRIFQATQSPHEMTKKDYMRFWKNPKDSRGPKRFVNISKILKRFRKVIKDSKKSEWFQNNPIDCSPKFYKIFKIFWEIPYVSGRFQEYPEDTRTFQKIPENSKGFHPRFHNFFTLAWAKKIFAEYHARQAPTHPSKTMSQQRMLWIFELIRSWCRIDSRVLTICLDATGFN